MSTQAVGNAVGHNPISIIIPCHRVVSCNGSLTGYAGGISKKIELLTLEQVDMTNPVRTRRKEQHCKSGKCPLPEKLIDCSACFIFSRNIQITNP